ncbi:element excision factor XisH family protein [Anaerolineales bacterium HSG24]|nr:element excision factor XisH family protein [Anaerolineales bacterium HSG24]
MPKKDIYHKTVINALTRDGWVITDDPLHLAYGGRNLYVDLGATQPIGAEKDGHIIAVEVKSFISASDVYELEHSIGQYRVYRNILTEIEPQRVIYLAIPLYSYKGIFQEPLGQLMIRQEQLKLIVFDERQEVIVQWIP